MTALAGAHFDGFGEASPLDLDLSPRMADQILDRIKDGTFDAFAQAASHVGHCAHPIRLTGSTTRIDAHTGEVLSVFRSADQPSASCTSGAATAARPSAHPARACMPATPSR